MKLLKLLTDLHLMVARLCIWRRLHDWTYTVK